jgi:outer membrane lipoprotein carrier protein
MRWTLALIASMTLSSVALAEPASNDGVAVQGQDAELEALMEGLAEKYRDTLAIQASFTQSTRSPAFGDGPTQQGTVTIARPRKLNIAFTQGSSAQFISDGETLWVYSPDQDQVIITPDLSQQSDGLSDLIESLSALQERFEVTALPAEPGSHAVSLAPRAGAQFKALRLTFDDGLLLTSLEIVDPFDSVTRMDFQGFSLDPTIPDGTFSFTAPEGTTVVRTDQM